MILTGNQSGVDCRTDSVANPETTADNLKYGARRTRGEGWRRSSEAFDKIPGSMVELRQGARQKQQAVRLPENAVQTPVGRPFESVRRRFPLIFIETFYPTFRMNGRSG